MEMRMGHCWPASPSTGAWSMYTRVLSNGVSQCFRNHQGAWRCALPSAAHAAIGSSMFFWRMDDTMPCQPLGPWLECR